MIGSKGEGGRVGRCLQRFIILPKAPISWDSRHVLCLHATRYEPHQYNLNLLSSEELELLEQRALRQSVMRTKGQS